VACPSSYRSIEKFWWLLSKVYRPRRSQSVPRRNLFELKSRNIKIILVIVQKIAFYKQSPEHICCCVYLIEANAQQYKTFYLYSKKNKTIPKHLEQLNFTKFSYNILSNFSKSLI